VAGAADDLLALIRVISEPKRASDYLAAMKAVLADAGRDAARLEADKQAQELAKREAAIAVREQALEKAEAAFAKREKALRAAEEAAAAKAARIRALLAGEQAAA
jgi:hypothetical protein